MLGSIEYSPSWEWAAVGKHPVARDYVRLGEISSFVERFAEWMDHGYRSMKFAEKKSSPTLCSWRFWSKGSGEEGLVCGVLRDSSDSLGRPYPFLVMGSGLLKGWEERWDLLPFACERTWGRMEFLSTQKLEDFQRLEIEIRQRMRPPIPEWDEHAGKRRSLGGGGATFDLHASDSQWRDLEQKATGLSGNPEIVLGLDQGPGKDPFALAAHWNYLLRTNGTSIPNVLFLGGSYERAYLALFQRPLIPSDFVQLWSVSFSAM